MIWTDREGRPVAVPEPAAPFYGAVGDFQGAAYERNAFAMGTEQEVAFLVESLEIKPGMAVVDVGCATGRHARALAERGCAVTGVDLSHGLLRVADEALPGCWVQADARALPLPTGCADIVLCLCQGGFGITPDGDEAILAELVRILAPSGRLALTAFSTWFAARFLAPDDAVDVARSLVHTPADVRAAGGAQHKFDLWTTCYTPNELRRLCSVHGLYLEGISGVAPGAYGYDPPIMLDPEVLVRASKPKG
jgi:SAM-dependent methyltransferase